MTTNYTIAIIALGTTILTAIAPATLEADGTFKSKFQRRVVGDINPSRTQRTRPSNIRHSGIPSHLNPVASAHQSAEGDLGDTIDKNNKRLDQLMKEIRVINLLIQQVKVANTNSTKEDIEKKIKKLLDNLPSDEQDLVMKLFEGLAWLADPESGKSEELENQEKEHNRALDRLERARRDLEESIKGTDFKAIERAERYFKEAAEAELKARAKANAKRKAEGFKQVHEGRFPKAENFKFPRPPNVRQEVWKELMRLYQERQRELKRLERLEQSRN